AMDATAVIPLMSWLLSEMVRYCSAGGDIDAARALIEELTNKVLPYFEEIDGRTYVNVTKLGAPDLALLLLYKAYPNRIDRQELVRAVARHGLKVGAAQMAVHRLRHQV